MKNDFDFGPQSKTQRWRDIKDLLARWIVGAGGISVIAAICLIMLYLVYEVYPLFKSATSKQIAEYTLPGDKNDTLAITIEERLRVAARISQSGHVYFFDTRDGKLLRTLTINIPASTSITSFYKSEPYKGSEKAEGSHNTETYALGLSDGRALVLRHSYGISNDSSGKLSVLPKIEYPYMKDPVPVSNASRPLTKIAFEWTPDGITLVALDKGGKLYELVFEKQSGLDADSTTYTSTHKRIAEYSPDYIEHLLVSKDRTSLYLFNKQSGLSFYNLRTPGKPLLAQHVPSIVGKAQVTATQLLVGGNSLIVGASDGRLLQFIQVRDDKNNYSLVKIREFSAQTAAIKSIAGEYQRKGFIAIDAMNNVALYHATAERVLLNKYLGKKTLRDVFIAPRADYALVLNDAGEVQALQIENKHPEVSWSTLWSKVMYENYSEPKYLWQSSSSTEDSEPKYSLIPLSFGTLKAAFYSMLISVPLAIMGAVFTAHFMSPRMRQMVKPGIEIMEALPTVVIGFIAGLWLAPIVADNLAAMFLVLLTIPLSIFVFGYIWDHLPAHIRLRVPDGWEAALLMPVIAGCVWFTFAVVGPAIEILFFNGSLSSHMTQAWGIPYSQRNAVVVGMAMGFAIIPIIFSIAEDALFGVPKHLIHGSLALGATPWQTLSRVVILTASPGIFSAVMIGFGRAIGETMIVLMATGNTAVLDLSPFQGMRPMSANVAVELPEAAQHSTHFRVLFLSALVLAIFTFFFNTAAEIVRHRLRKKYSSL